MASDIKLYNRDCLEAMREMPDKCFDLAIVDPPYGINADKGIQKNEGKFGFKKHRNTDWDSSIPSEEYFKELFRVSENQIIWGGNYFTEFLPPRMCWLIWDKMQTNFSFSDFELAWTSYNTKCKKFDLIRGFDEKGKHYSTDNSRIHPTQKPTALYKWIINSYCKDDFKILDTHLGSGSIALACYDMGYDLTGFEIDKEYFDNAVKRLETHKQQLTVF